MYLRILFKGGHIKPNMQSLTTLLIACLALTSAAPASVLEMRDTPADSGTMLMLLPFSRILANVPFNVLVMPGMYSMKTAADKVVTDALQTNVTDGLLTLTTNTSFSTNKPIKVQHLLTSYWQCTLPWCASELQQEKQEKLHEQVTVMLPAGNFTSANVTGSFSLLVGSGFSATNFSAFARGAAFVAVKNMTATHCVVSARGCAPLKAPLLW